MDFSGLPLASSLTLYFGFLCMAHVYRDRIRQRFVPSFYPSLYELNSIIDLIFCIFFFTVSFNTVQFFRALFFALSSEVVEDSISRL